MDGCMGPLQIKLDVVKYAFNFGSIVDISSTTLYKYNMLIIP